MALPASKIFLRSPYWISKTRTNLNYILVDLYVWNGDLVADEPVSPSIQLRSTAFDGSASIDIAEFARDLVEVTFTGTQDSNAVWVKYQITWVDNDETTGVDTAVSLTGLDGFSYFEDGINYQYPRNVLMGQNTIRTSQSKTVKVPVLQDKLVSYGLQTYSAGAYGVYTQFHTVTGLTPTEDTDSVIKYVNSSYGGTYADRIQFNFSSGSPEYVYIEYEDCTRYGVQEVFFVNRYGAIQELNTFGRFDVSLSTEDEKFKRNLLVNGSYSTTRHQNTVLMKNGKIMMALNTGWYLEEDNDIFIEMMLSEQIWIRVNKSTLGIGWLPKTSSSFIIPVNLTSQQMQVKNKLNDKMINYTFEFEAAADRINTVR